MSDLNESLRTFQAALKSADAVDSLISVQDALKDGTSPMLKAALKRHDGVTAAKILVNAMKRTGTSASDVVKLLGSM